jgi:glycosyltransferase involved in cell wall biosynthesis
MASVFQGQTSSLGIERSFPGFALPIRVAIVTNSATPYRIHLHKRLARECPEMEIRSIFTHEFSNARWSLSIPAEIRPVFFGIGEASESQGLTHRPLHEIRKAVRIMKHLKGARIQAVILFGYNDWCRLALLAWCRRRNIPCFIFGDSNLLCEATAGIGIRLKRMLLPKILNLSSGAFHCGRRGADYFRRYGVLDKRIFPFPYEPDYSQVSDLSNAGLERGMREFGLDSNRRRIVYSGRLVAEKRVDLLIGAFQALAGERPEWDLVIAGDGSLRAQLDSLVIPELRGRVRFLGFINEPEKLAAVYKCSDILALPSDWEPWGVVVTEAATCMALICSSNVGAGIDLVEEHRNGRTFEAGSAAALESALREVTAPDRIDQMKAASPSVLAAWRSRTDPVAGLRCALRAAGLPGNSPDRAVHGY